MDKKDTGAGKKPAPFKPENLTQEQLEQVVEFYTGVHPKYFLASGLNIRLNHGKFRSDGNHFNGWKFNKRKYHG